MDFSHHFPLWLLWSVISPAQFNAFVLLQRIATTCQEKLSHPPPPRHYRHELPASTSHNNNDSPSTAASGPLYPVNDRDNGWSADRTALDTDHWRRVRPVLT